MLLSLIFSALIGIFFTTKVLAATVASPMPGYGVVDIQWKVQATPDGPYIAMNGTVQHVTAKLTKLNPNWKQDFNFDNISTSAAKLEERGFWTNKDPCGTRWEPTTYHFIEDGIAYLKGVPGRPGEGPGPGHCGRVSCSWASAIWWCNDNSQAFELDSYFLIADGAQWVLDRCANQINGRYMVAGQAWNSDNWNVVVRKDESDGCSDEN